ncbi:MAG TPA: rhodanese-like domain-containing protein, partial [Longimicrobiaceae bacterium]|nr:rhodanese-like domain-containing protein [Longimicrobiaceae bacterium]
TPEHLAFVVTDTAAADRPIGVLTGDFLFVGDVGRPDLLERAARHAGTMEAGARTLFRSLRRFAEALPDYVQVWPGHGAGSACGKALGSLPSSTVGYEKLFNRAFGFAREDDFVRDVLAGQPEPPLYFAEMKRVNRDGPRLLGGMPAPPRLPAARLDALLAEGAAVVDTRPAADFARRHVPGTLSVPLGKSFPTWAGSVLGYDRPLYLIAAAECVGEAVRDLARVGLDRVDGWLGPEAVDAWTAAHGPAASVPEVTPGELETLRLTGAVEVIDVRNASEHEAGHLPGALNLPLGRLAERLDAVPRHRPLVVHCQGGSRAWVAAALLKARGFADVRHLAGDYAAWAGEGRPVEVGTGAVAV